MNFPDENLGNKYHYEPSPHTIFEFSFSHAWCVFSGIDFRSCSYRARILATISFSFSSKFVWVVACGTERYLVHPQTANGSNGGAVYLRFVRVEKKIIAYIRSICIRSEQKKGSSLLYADHWLFAFFVPRAHVDEAHQFGILLMPIYSSLHKSSTFGISPFCVIRA